MIKPNQEDKPRPLVKVEVWMYIPDDLSLMIDGSNGIEKHFEDEMHGLFDGILNIEVDVQGVHHTPDPGEGFIREFPVDNSSRTGIDGVNDK